MDGPPQYPLAASADVPVAVKLFQAIFELFDSKFLLMQHDSASFRVVNLYSSRTAVYSSRAVVYSSNNLEAVAGIFPARIRNGKDPYALVTGADVGNRDAELFQTGFELFDSKFLLVQHDSVSF